MNTKNVRTTSTLTPRVKQIVTTPLEVIVPHLRPLLAALLLSHPDEEDRMRFVWSGNQEIITFLKNVTLFRQDASLMQAYIDDGFFVEATEYFLRASKKSLDAGARLMPVFCTLLSNADHFKIPKPLKNRVLHQIEWQKKKDGFAITSLSRDCTEIHPADDVLPI